MFKVKKEVYRGFAAVMAFLLVVVTYGSQIANAYSGRINTVLGITTSKVVPGEGLTEI